MDLHRHFIDHLTIPDAAGTGVLRRVDEVFDCWFESGSMPYAQVHYPFEHKEAFEAQFPADFVAEGVGFLFGTPYHPCLKDMVALSARKLSPYRHFCLDRFYIFLKGM